jgi:hypothetical protein
MEIALLTFARDIQDFGEAAVLSEIPFDSDRRRMSVVIEHEGQRWLYCKGAPEAVLPLCVSTGWGDGECALDAAARQRIGAAQDSMADQGLRVLAFACRPLPDNEPPSESALIFSGLIGLQDPPRPEVPEAMARCHSAGIKVIMVTGDHPHTALAIARAIGLVRSENPLIVAGEALRKMTAAQLQIALDSPEILFTRVTAEQKMLVVQALKTVTAELFKRDAPADGSLEDIQITKLALLQLGKHPFYHGASFIHGRPVSMLYFEDIDMGMVCVASTFPYMQFARFTCYRVKDLDQNSIFAPGNRTAH